MTSPARKLRVFIDADVLFAAAASGSEHGASLVVLRLAEITLIELYTSAQVITEVERNLSQKLPAALTLFRLLVEKSLQVLPDPASEQLVLYEGQADPKDLPILVAALDAEVEWFLTFNTRHFRPATGSIRVGQPGLFVQEIRHLLTALGNET